MTPHLFCATTFNQAKCIYALNKAYSSCYLIFINTEYKKPYFD